MKKEDNRYEEWLTTIANTRLIYNTMKELEDMMDCHSIHSNGIKRCFTTEQKLRAAFRDLKVEVNLMTSGSISLDSLLTKYKETWEFYHANLARRSEPSSIVLEILAYCFPPYKQEGFSKKKVELYDQIIEQDISITLLILMLMKVLPGYDSKNGDVLDMPHRYEEVMTLLDKFCSQIPIFSTLPAITSARGEENKTRLMLIYHVEEILDIYLSYADADNVYETSSGMKAKAVAMNIDGYWNECNGELSRTDFWQIESALAEGSYFATHWHKDASNKLTGIRYTLFLYETTDENVLAYMIHPEAIKHRMEGKEYGDGDNVWYQMPMPSTDRPLQLPLVRKLVSFVWPKTISLTRVTDEEVLNVYERWMNSCEKVKEFAELEYYFEPNLYAVTTQALYIPTGKEHQYYRVPKDAYEGLEHIQIGDNVGILTMNNRQYITFDEFLLYISTSKAERKKYGIEVVNKIE